MAYSVSPACHATISVLPPGPFGYQFCSPPQLNALRTNSLPCRRIPCPAAIRVAVTTLVLIGLPLFFCGTPHAGFCDTYLIPHTVTDLPFVAAFIPAVLVYHRDVQQQHSATAHFERSLRHGASCMVRCYPDTVCRCGRRAGGRTHTRRSPGLPPPRRAFLTHPADTTYRCAERGFALRAARYSSPAAVGCGFAGASNLPVHQPARLPRRPAFAVLGFRFCVPAFYGSPLRFWIVTNSGGTSSNAFTWL